MVHERAREGDGTGRRRRSDLVVVAHSATGVRLPGYHRRGAVLRGSRHSLRGARTRPCRRARRRGIAGDAFEGT